MHLDTTNLGYPEGSTWEWMAYAMRHNTTAAVREHMLERNLSFNALLTNSLPDGLLLGGADLQPDTFPVVELIARTLLEYMQPPLQASSRSIWEDRLLMLGILQGVLGLGYSLLKMVLEDAKVPLSMLYLSLTRGMCIAMQSIRPGPNATTVASFLRFLRDRYGYDMGRAHLESARCDPYDSWDYQFAQQRSNCGTLLTAICYPETRQMPLWCALAGACFGLTRERMSSGSELPKAIPADEYPEVASATIRYLQCEALRSSSLRVPVSALILRLLELTVYCTAHLSYAVQAMPDDIRACVQTLYLCRTVHPMLSLMPPELMWTILEFYLVAAGESLYHKEYSAAVVEGDKSYSFRHSERIVRGGKGYPWMHGDTLRLMTTTMDIHLNVTSANREILMNTDE